MPRRKATEMNYEEQLKKIEEKLERYRKYVSDLEAEQEELLEKKRTADVKMLYQYMEENHITVPEVLAVLSAKSEAPKAV